MQDDNNSNSSSNASPPLHRHLLSSRNFLVAFVILVIVVIGGFTAAKYHKKSNTPAQSMWTTYVSQKYGFKFDYLKSWGKPSVGAYDFLGGKKVAVSFTNKINNVWKPGSPPPVTTHTYSIIMVSDTAANACIAKGGECNGGPLATKSMILSQLKKPSAIHARQDSDSFALVSTNPYVKLQSLLEIYQIVSLPRLGISAVYGSYTIGGDSPDCVPNQLSFADRGCVTPKDYSDLSKSLKSVRTI